MKDYPFVVRILMVIGLFLVASLALKIIIPVVTGLIGLIFKIAILLLIAIWLVNWLTKKRQRRY
ncbi:hypothetical protein [Enterococcus sp. CSURQ0835]|uniref:hypothetical protein n=1 Tax=Enterococcus sp. CSURQ0835 TaxID=2681394 RepID=UPI0013598FB8|nr:hypothetical protein [Enterococcus sp. CSURQ0835]